MPFLKILHHPGDKLASDLSPGDPPGTLNVRGRCAPTTSKTRLKLSTGLHNMSKLLKPNPRPAFFSTSGDALILASLSMSFLTS
eukprot:15505091-Heterocapsa_arctica.AAC.1